MSALQNGWKRRFCTSGKHDTFEIPFPSLPERPDQGTRMNMFLDIICAKRTFVNTLVADGSVYVIIICKQM